ncbi:GNAT family N-acetyltransferase [Streptomyces sp. NPDC055078]
MPTPLPELFIRRLTLDDLLACADLAENRGWAREENRWSLLLTAGTGYGIDDPSGKGLVSSCVLTSYGPRLSAIGMMLVAKEYARQGIGRRMMRHVIEEAGSTPLTLYATPYGQPLYEELGFSAVGRAEMIHGRLTAPALTAATSVAIRPATAEDLSAIVRLDTEVFGLDRTHMIARLPAFADHLRVAEENGVLTGYAAAWPSMGTHVIGPLIAHGTATAKALIASLGAATDRPLRTDIDIRHEELLRWLKEHGLKTAAFNTVMTYAVDNLPGDWRRRFAPLSLAVC